MNDTVTRRGHDADDPDGAADSPRTYGDLAAQPTSWGALATTVPSFGDLADPISERNE